MIGMLLLACAPEVAAPAPAVDPALPGRHAVAHHAASVARGERTLPVEVWYPTTAVAEGGPVPEAFYGEPLRTTYADLLAAADPTCPTTTVSATRDGAPAAGSWPVVVFSHCTDCTRFASFSVAERLASHGIVVVAPDHVGDTLPDELADASLPLDTATLAMRREDLGAVLDAALDGALVEGLTLDPARVGALGHSFGSVTVGLFTQEDARVQAVMGMAAPMENPLLPGVDMAALDLPLLLLVAQEDHSIFELGNRLIRDNWSNAPGPAWKAEMQDAGHWSVSDLCGLVPGFMPCCGEDEREGSGEPFRYVDPATGRARTATVAAAFFLQTFELASGTLDGLQVEGVELEGR